MIYLIGSSIIFWCAYMMWFELNNDHSQKPPDPHYKEMSYTDPMYLHIDQIL